MRCEVIAVGTELLLGQIVDTNSSWIGEKLALAGINSHFQTKVGDNLARITSALRIALERSDAVIVCGGLGPTQDDITREAIAQVMGVGLVRDDEMVAAIAGMFEGRGRRFPMNNARQADRPEGADFIHQTMGTAPGLICPIGDKVVYAVPGVPYEMQDMMERAILPDLARRAGVSTVIRSRTLRTWGESESGLAEMLAGRITELDAVGNPTLAFLASGIEGLKVRITASGADEAEVDAVLDAEEARLRSMMGPLVFGADDTTMEAAVLELLAGQGLTLAVAESVTGGLVSARITDVPGASKVFRGGVVGYASEVKFDVLDVPEGPVVSGDAARAMAVGVRRRLGADVGLAVTGVAGPEPQDGQPVGTVWFALAFGDDEVDVHNVTLPGDRYRIRQFATITVLNFLRLRLEGAQPG